MQVWFRSIFFLILMTTSQAACASKTLNCVNPFLLGLLKHKLKSKVVVQKITTTQAPIDCICVPYYQCDANNTIITDGLGLIDIRANYRPRRCTGDLEVCCKPPKPQPPPQSTTQPAMMATTPLIFSTTPTQVPTTLPPTTKIPGTSSTYTSIVTTMVTTLTSATQTSPPPTTKSSTQPTTISTTSPAITSTVPSTTKSILPLTTIPTSPPTTRPTSPPTTSSRPTSSSTTPQSTSSPTMTLATSSTFRPTSPSTSLATSPSSSPIITSSPTTRSTPSITTPRITTSSSEECICVPSYLCDKDGYIITNGEGIINPRLTSLPCSSANEVCCKVRNENNMLSLTNLKSTTKSSSTITSAATSSSTMSTRPMTTSTMSTTTSTMSNNPMTTSTTISSTRPMTTSTMSTRPMTTSSTVSSTTSQLSADMCVCVLPSQCDSNGYVIVSGSGVIDPRFRQSRQATNICVPPEICCKLPLNNQDYGVIFPDDDQTQTSVAIDPRANLTSDIKNEGTANACRCVKSASCTAENEVELDAAGIIDSRFRLCLPLDEVCCKLKGIISLSTSTSRPTTTNSSKVVNKEPVPNSGEPSCGVPGPPCKPDECPTDNGSAYFAEFPWMVALLSRQDTGQALFLCGGSLIHLKAVLSATHCVLNSSRQKGTIIARVGEYNTLFINESAPFQEAEIQAIVTHPQYYSGGLYNDIAVLILQTPVNYAVNVVPICLPERTTMFDAGTRCLASGWGKDGFDGKYQKVLQKIDLPIVDRHECLNRLRDTRLGKYFQLHSSFMCAGGEESKDTCTGDGGGPLMCPTPTGQFIQVGIVSWGIGCGESNVPAVYVNVAPFRSWIDQQLSSYGLL